MKDKDKSNVLRGMAFAIIVVALLTDGILVFKYIKHEEKFTMDTINATINDTDTEVEY